MPPDYVLTLLPVQIIGGVSVVAAVAWLWKAAIRPAYRSWRVFKARLDEFFDGWFGRPARPGFPAEPGVPERLAAYDERIDGMTAALTEHAEAIADIRYHVQPNHGESAHDALTEQIKELSREVRDMGSAQVSLAGAVDRLREDKERAHEEMLRRISRIELPRGEES